MTAGQVSDYIGDLACSTSFPKLNGCSRTVAMMPTGSAMRCRKRASLPDQKSREEAVKYDKRRYKRRNRIEIIFGRLKDFRRVKTRYDRCPTAFFSAIALAAIVIFWL